MAEHWCLPSRARSTPSSVIRFWTYPRGPTSEYDDPRALHSSTEAPVMLPNSIAIPVCLLSVMSCQSLGACPVVAAGDVACDVSLASVCISVRQLACAETTLQNRLICWLLLRPVRVTAQAVLQAMSLYLTSFYLPTPCKLLHQTQPRTPSLWPPFSATPHLLTCPILHTSSASLTLWLQLHACILPAYLQQLVKGGTHD